ncbi:MAG: zinc-ribbon domain-containing protein [Alphaproteobacteria bacterium]|nr:zinc-ribbon domain-containing protein [Alphaproteobacteria bacterium]
MIITCPACSARFNVADQLIGTTGRVVRCAKCGHKWHQMPEGMEGMAPPPPAPPPPKPQARPAPAAAAAARPAAPKGQAPSPLPKLAQIPLEMPAQGGDVKEDGGDDIDLSAALDRVAGEIAESDARHAFQSAAPQQKAAEDRAGRDMPDDFDFGEGDPIPEVFTKTGAQAKPEGRSKLFGALILLLTVIIVLGGLAAGAYFLRTKVVEMWPDATAFYEAVGIEAEALGAGLKFRNVTSERVIENNVEMLVVRGVIANISDKSRDLPLVKLSLYDGANLVVGEKVTPPPERSIAPNEETGFKVSIESPAAAARRFEVTFAPRPGQD